MRTLLCLLFLTLTAQAELPLGQPGLRECRTCEDLAPGVSYIQITRGQPCSEPYYVEVEAGLTEAEAREKAAALGASVQHMAYGSLWRVRLGPFSTLEEARKAGPRILYPGEDPGSNSGPWRIHVLDLAPGTKIHAQLCTNVVEGVETVSRLARRKKAVAAVNGGYFVMEAVDGVQGDPAGACVLDGELISESVGQRAALILGDGRPRIGRVKAEFWLNGRAAGLNRSLGRIRSGSNVLRHDVTFHPADDLVCYTPAFGERTPKGPAEEAVLHRRSFHWRKGPGPIPKDGSVLVAQGEAAKWLHRQEGILTHTRLTENGQPLRLHKGMDIVSGGPILVHEGQVQVNAQAEGFAWSPAFLETFGLRRHARTLAGITRDGRLLLVVVDGGQPYGSVGLTFRESAELLKALGAVEGMNLDGGGSSTMFGGGLLLNRPSDPAGERPVGDALLIFGK